MVSQQEQTEVAALEQVGLVLEQPTAVSTDVQPSVSTDAAVAVPSIEFATDADALKFIEEHPRLKDLSDKRYLDGENTGKQRRDRELRLERGTEEVARQWQDHLATRYGIELDEADAKDAPLWVRANRDTERASYWRTATEQTLDAFDVADRQKITAALEQFEGMPDQTEAIARQVIDTAVSRQSERRIADLTVDDVLKLPIGSKLRDSFESFKAAEFEKEEAARAQEKMIPSPPPRTPVGGAATQRTRNDYANLSPTEIAELPEAEYRIAMGYGAA